MLLGYWILYRLSTKDIGQDYVVLLVAKLMLAPKLKNAVLHCADFGIGFYRSADTRRQFAPRQIICQHNLHSCITNDAARIV